MLEAVTGKKIKNHTIAKKKLAKKTVAALKGATGPQGPAGPQGPTGAKGAQGAQGVQGLPGPFPTSLPSGDTLVGTLDLAGYASSTSDYLTGTISYGYPVNSSHLVAYVSGVSTNPDCPGTHNNPQALPGHTCIYQWYSNNSPGATINYNGTYGVGLFAHPTAAGEMDVTVTWAVTGP